MIPLPPDATPNDIEQWCSRGVVMFRRDDGDWVPGFYQNCSPRRVLALMSLAADDDASPVLVHADQVCVHWPRCGSVNIPGAHYAVHASRLTQRQYRRTWHVAGLRVVTPRAWDVAKWNNVVPTLMRTTPTDLARACFLGTYPSMTEADALINAEARLTVAISPRLIVAGDRGGKRMFYYNGQLAATASDGILHSVGEDVPVRKIAKMLEGRYHVAASI